MVVVRTTTARRLRKRRKAAVIESLDSIVNVIAPWGDLAALFAVMFLAGWRRNAISLVVLLDFAIVYFGQDWLKTLEFWGAKGLDYHYGLGIKDCLIALILVSLRANPLLSVIYGVASVLSWSVWASYQLLEYELFLMFWYAWSPLYFIGMFVQVAALWMGGANGGKRARTVAVPANRDRFHGGIVDTSNSYYTPPSQKMG